MIIKLSNSPRTDHLKEQIRHRPHDDLTSQRSVMVRAASAFLALVFVSIAPAGAEAGSPIRALMVTGGCCHDYDSQREIISQGVTERLGEDAIEWTIIQEGGESRDHELSIFGEDNWSEPYDVVVHNTCFGNTTNAAFIESFVQEHGATGTAAVFLHCALHSYRHQDETDAYRELTGVRSMSHEGHRPLDVRNLEPGHPVMAEFPDTWTTPNGELYMIEHVWPNVTRLAEAYGEDTEQDHLVIWTNEYQDARVFGTTLGHHNETMEHPVYLDTLTRGLLWSVGRLEDFDSTRQAEAGNQLSALIVDGRNNHNWQATTPLMRTILEQSGRFTVDVATAEDVSDFHPSFADYDVIVLNYNGELWPEQTREDFLDYVSGGGGVAVVHAANNSFPEWEEYNRIIGLGGWGGRNESHGPYVYYNEEDDLVRDTRPGSGGGHGPQKEFVIQTREPDHPIMQGLPDKWLHAQDELYNTLRGPAEALTILGTAWTDRTGRHEPQLMTIDYGEGRVFHTTLGHGVEAHHGLGFQVTLQRGAEWAATGEVTIPAAAPDELPAEGEAATRNPEEILPAR